MSAAVATCAASTACVACGRPLLAHDQAAAELCREDGLRLVDAWLGLSDHERAPRPRMPRPAPTGPTKGLRNVK